MNKLLPESLESILNFSSILTESKIDDLLATIPLAKILKYYLKTRVEIKDLNLSFTTLVGYSFYTCFIESLETLNLIDEKIKFKADKYIIDPYDSVKSSYKASEFNVYDINENDIYVDIEKIYRSYLKKSIEAFDLDMIFEHVSLNFERNFYVVMKGYESVFSVYINYIDSSKYKSDIKINLFREHYSNISEEFENEAIFGNLKGVSLNDIYVKPSYKVIRLQDLRNSLGSNDTQEENEKTLQTIINNNKEIQGFINSLFLEKNSEGGAELNIKMLIILGYPGQGKSSLAKKLIYDNFSKTTFHQSKFILLKFKEILNIRKLFDNPIETFLNEINENINILGKSNIFSKDDLENTILILDGLDEISIRDQLITGDIDEFIRLLYKSILTRYKNLRLIITSRHGYISLENLPEKYTICLDIDEFCVEKQKKWLSLYNKYYKTIITTSLIDEINSKPFFSNLKNLISQPVILYLIVESNINPTTVTSRVGLYESLFNEIINKRYSKDKHGILKKISPQDIRKLVQGIAIEIFMSEHEFIHSNQLAKLEVVEEFYKILNENDNYKKSLESSRHLSKTLKGVMIAFYFKEENRGGDNYVIEFYHKSLQEFLVAEKIWDSVNLINKESSEVQLRTLNSLFAKKLLTNEIQSYLSEMIEKLSKEERMSLYMGFRRSIDYFFENDFIFSLESEHNSYALSMSRNTFYSFWFFYTGLLKTRIVTNKIEFIQDIVSKRVREITRQKRDILPEKARFRLPIYLGFISNLRLSLDLTGITLENINFSNINITNINFCGAKLINCMFDNCYIVNCNFSYTIFNLCSFKDSFITCCDFSHSVGEQIDFTGAFFKKLIIDNIDWDDTWFSLEQEIALKLND